jgi:haloalkane dehalogenase
LLGELGDQARVLAVDHLGCGLSDAPGEDYPYSLKSHTDNLVRWLELHDLKKILLVVHDWGGAIGLGAYLRVPERFEQLLILNTAAFAPPPTWIPWRIAACRLPWVGSWAIRQHNAFARAAIWMAMERPEGLSPVSAQGLLAPYQEPARRIAIDRFVRDIPMTHRHPTWKVLCDLESGLKRLPPIATHLVWGMKDWCFTPRCLQRMLDIFPHASVERLDRTGHYVMEESPSAVVAAARRMLGPPPDPLAPKDSVG